jgi:hypothetical protein
MREARANAQAYEAEARERLRAISYELTGLVGDGASTKGSGDSPGDVTTHPHTDGGLKVSDREIWRRIQEMEQQVTDLEEYFMQQQAAKGQERKRLQ